MTGKAFPCLVAILMLCCLTEVGGFCMMAQVTNSGSGVCLYEYANNKSLVIMANGDHMNDLTNCMDCSCDNGFLGCCAMGIGAGVMSLPGCRQISGPDCTVLWVDAEDETKECSLFAKPKLPETTETISVNDNENK